MLYHSVIIGNVAEAADAAKVDYEKSAIRLLDKPTPEAYMDCEYYKGVYVGMEIATQMLIVKCPANLTPSNN